MGFDMVQLNEDRAHAWSKCGNTIINGAFYFVNVNIIVLSIFDNIFSICYNVLTRERDNNDNTTQH